MNTWQGQSIRISIFGESHANAIGCVADGFPGGICLDFDYINKYLSFRKPHGAYTTARNESDEYEILSGVTHGKTNGSPLCAVFRNRDVKRSDYDTDIMRPSHSDLPSYIKYNGNSDLSGGGHFSARLTAPMVFIGAICKNLLEKQGIYTASAVYSIGDVHAKSFYDTDITDELLHGLFCEKPIIADSHIFDEILRNVKNDGDSVGSCVEFCAKNLPIGLGEPFFDSVESTMARLMFSVPAVKSVEFGKGIALCSMRGSQSNDEYDAESVKNYIQGRQHGDIAYTNNMGGISGGLTNSMPLICKVGFKPIPSIAKIQRTVNIKTLEEAQISVHGRHDVCCALRGVHCVDAMGCICLYDFLTGAKK